MVFKIKFHRVGFGLFTSGEIGNFKFVYDCGSSITSIANKCVDEDFEVGEHLGFIAISHFHKDHISGLKRLLDRVGHVDSIILPYLTPRERLNYLLTLDLDYLDFDWIEDFISDPSDFLLNSDFSGKISQVVFISNGPAKYRDENRNEPLITPDLINESLVFDINSLEPSDDEEKIKEVEGIEDSRVLIKKHGGITLTIGKIKIWQFIFYYCPQSEKVDRYLKEIADCSKFISDEITKKDLNAIISDAKFSKIAQKHSVNNSDINNTSLILYHSPIHLRNWESYKCFRRHDIERLLFVGRDTGYLYTGDVNLNQKHSEISLYYDSLLGNIGVFQVPHHGSIDNWHNFITEQNSEMLHIISSNYNNSRRLHPNTEVLFQITKHQGIILWCNEKKEVEIYDVT